MIYEDADDLVNEQRVAMRVAQAWQLQKLVKPKGFGIDRVAYRSKDDRVPCCSFEIRCRSKRFKSLLVDQYKLYKIKQIDMMGVPAFFVVEWGGVIQYCRPALWEWKGRHPVGFRCEAFQRSARHNQLDVNLCVFIPAELLTDIEVQPEFRCA